MKRIPQTTIAVPVIETRYSSHVGTLDPSGHEEQILMAMREFDSGRWLSM